MPLLILAWAQLIVSMLSTRTPIGNIALINIIVFIGTAIYSKLSEINSKLQNLIEEVRKHTK